MNKIQPHLLILIRRKPSSRVWFKRLTIWICSSVMHKGRMRIRSNYVPYRNHRMECKSRMKYTIDEKICVQPLAKYRFCIIPICYLFSFYVQQLSVAIVSHGICLLEWICCAIFISPHITCVFFRNLHKICSTTIVRGAIERDGITVNGTTASLFTKSHSTPSEKGSQWVERREMQRQNTDASRLPLHEKYTLSID